MRNSKSHYVWRCTGGYMHMYGFKILNSPFLKNIICCSRDFVLFCTSTVGSISGGAGLNTKVPSPE